MNCFHCGNTIQNGIEQCPFCGARQQVHVIPAQNIYRPNQPTEGLVPLMKPWEIVAMFLLQGIPFIGLILTIVWAADDSNLMRRNIMRGQLLIIAIMIVLSILMMILFWVGFSALFSALSR